MACSSLQANACSKCARRFEADVLRLSVCCGFAMILTALRGRIGAVSSDALRGIGLRRRSANAELLHATAQCARSQVQELRRPLQAFDDPGSAFEHGQDVTTFHLFERAGSVHRGRAGTGTAFAVQRQR